MKYALATASLMTILAAGSVMAQSTAPTTAPPAKSPTPPATTAPGSSSTQHSPAAKPSEAPAMKPGSSSSASLETRSWRVSKLIGHKIVNAARENVGDINDVLITNDGKVQSVIVGVGGFLGMGEKNVALSFGQLAINRDAGNNVTVMVNASKDTLQKAPEWHDPATPAKPAAK